MDDQKTFGPMVVWIAVPPDSTKASAVCNAMPDILNILADTQIHNVVVEWYEGSVKRLVSLPLMSVEEDTSLKFSFNHTFNTGLGIPITRPDDNVQGTLTFLFWEVKTSNSNPVTEGLP